MSAGLKHTNTVLSIMHDEGFVSCSKETDEPLDEFYKCLLVCAAKQPADHA